MFSSCFPRVILLVLVLMEITQSDAHPWERSDNVKRMANSELSAWDEKVSDSNPLMVQTNKRNVVSRVSESTKRSAVGQEPDAQKDGLCRSVCRFCEKRLSRSHSALCSHQCDSGGRSYLACLTLYTFVRK